MPVSVEKLAQAVGALPYTPVEAEFLLAVAQVACTHLGCRSAAVWTAGAGGSMALAAQSPGVPGDRQPPAIDGPGLWLLKAPSRAVLLQAEPAGDPGVLEAYAVAAGRIMEELRARERLTRRVEELAQRTRVAEERHRGLALRVAELRGELDTSEQRQVILHERNRIAQDLHDRAAQTNFLVQLKLDWVLTHVPDDSPLRVELERLRELAGQAAAQTREAIYALRAPELTEGGLPGGLRRLVRGLEGYGLGADLSVLGMPAPLPDDVEDALFKVAQEALTNARKHSHGSAVMVTLRFAPDAVSLVVQDDGVGLPPGAEERAGADGRYGLQGMRERLVAVGGDLRLVCGDEGGLIVRATIALKR